jgi:hypothetical protein
MDVTRAWCAITKKPRKCENVRHRTVEELVKGRYSGQMASPARRSA